MSDLIHPDNTAGAAEVSVESQAQVTDWYGPDDPDNPWNWPPLVKWYHAYIVAGTAFVSTFGSSVAVPVVNDIAAEFGISQETLVVLPYAIYILGLSFGTPFTSPLSETLGRRSVFWTSLPFFLLFVLGTGFANNLTALCILRFLAGFFGSPSLTVGGGVIADLWAPEQRGLPIVLLILSPFLGPAIGPLVGSAVSLHLSWRWTSWCILFFSLGLFVVPTPFMRETYKKTILQRRARKLGIAGPPGVMDGRNKSQALIYFVTANLTRPFHMFFTEPIITAFVLYVGFNFALLYAFFAAFQYVFSTHYEFGRLSVGLTFLGLGTGCLLGATLLILFEKLYYQKLVAKAKDKAIESNSTSRIAPEERLLISMVGGPLITVALFLYGWSTATRAHWIVPVIAEAIFGCGNLLVFISSITYIADVYGALYGASALASNSIVRYLMGFIFPLFAVQMFHNLNVQWACTLLGCLSALGMFIPFAIYRYGPYLRSKIKYQAGQ